MPKQKSIKPFPYILEEDRDTPEEQTIFYLMPRTVEESSQISGLYSGVLKSKPGFRNTDSVDSNAMRRAQIDAFVHYTIGPPGVEHYWFSDKFPELNEEKWMDISNDDETTLKCLAKDLKTNQLQELFEMADRGFSDTEKKKLSCSDTSSTGSKRSRPAEGSILAATAKSSG